MTDFRKRMRPVNDAATEFEKTWTWIQVSRAFRRANPMCQVIEDGKPCRTKAELVHHLVSPSNTKNDGWAKRMDWRNLVSLCWKHHGPEAGDAGRYDYHPTQLFDGTMLAHAPNVRKTESQPITKERMDALMADVTNVDPDELLALIGESGK